jgi:hypothetical protein
MGKSRLETRRDTRSVEQMNVGGSIEKAMPLPV